MKIRTLAIITLLAALLAPLPASALSLFFSSTAECDAGLGRITNSGPMPSANCYQEQAIPVGEITKIEVVAEAEASSNWGPQRIGVEAEAQLSTSDAGGPFHASSTTEIRLMDEFSVEAPRRRRTGDKRRQLLGAG